MKDFIPKSPKMDTELQPSSWGCRGGWGIPFHSLVSRNSVHIKEGTKSQLVPGAGWQRPFYTRNGVDKKEGADFR